jgi:hypothetical protein
MSIYAEYLDKFPCLLQKGYGFAFFPEEGIKGIEKKFDDKIAHTIKSIAFDF